MRRALLIGLLAPAVACSDTSGDVLTTLGDGGAGADADPFAIDADLLAPDADPLAPDAAVDCASDGPCPDPNFTNVTVCGRLVDLETSEVLAGDGTITVQFYNLIDFPAGPSLAEVEPDACGWYHADDVGGLIPGVMVMGTDDAELSGTTYSRVVSVLPSTPGGKVRANAFALRTVVDQQWGDAAGLGGASFSDVGALMLMFFDSTQTPMFPFAGSPVSGVTLTEDGATRAADDYYFSDAAPLSRVTVDPVLSVTGANGSGLFINTDPLSDYSGASAGCTFGDTNGVIPGIVQAQELFGSCE